MLCAGNCGYHVVPVQEILMAGRAKYQELLSSALAAQLAAQARAPPLRLNRRTLCNSDAPR